MREKYYGHAQTEALEGLRKYGNDPLLKFYIGANKILEGLCLIIVKEYHHCIGAF